MGDILYPQKIFFSKFKEKNTTIFCLYENPRSRENAGNIVLIYIMSNKSIINIVNVYLSHEDSARKHPLPIETQLGSVKQEL